ncbi:hypothetical protein EYV94_27410 [Puteibacter caeruleilacunae]|nr:hypothetical protein EYV94_27410 [Puteibacter caeruleilacunae]
MNKGYYLLICISVLMITCGNEKPAIDYFSFKDSNLKKRLQEALDRKGQEGAKISMYDSLVPSIKAKMKDTACITNEDVTDYEIEYKKLEREIYQKAIDSQQEGIDFSDLTEGLESAHGRCQNDLKKRYLGLKLAKNYLLHYLSSSDTEYLRKCEKVFLYSLKGTSIGNQKIYLKTNEANIRSLFSVWENCNDSEKKDILLHALLREFYGDSPAVLLNEQ